MTNNGKLHDDGLLTAYLHVQTIVWWIACLVFGNCLHSLIWIISKCFLIAYGRMLRKAKTEVLALKWSLKEINIDNEMYVMWHMKTYMGIKVKDWNCDLNNKQSKAFQLLCAKYCQAMVYSTENTLWIKWWVQQSRNQSEDQNFFIITEDQNMTLVRVMTVLV